MTLDLPSSDVIDSLVAIRCLVSFSQAYAEVRGHSLNSLADVLQALQKIAEGFSPLPILSDINHSHLLSSLLDSKVGTLQSQICIHCKVGLQHSSPPVLDLIRDVNVLYASCQSTGPDDKELDPVLIL